MRFTLALLLLLSTPAFAQQTNDAAYTEAIRKNTTEPRFLTELVDHLPASDTVPTPLKFHGYIAGAEGKLTYAADVHRYMRALEAASPRVKVFSLGKSEEGREMIVVAIANEETIANLDKYRDITRKLADPRKLTDDEARALIASGKPIYHATGALHSVETGSPEMLMELAYRLAVEDTPFIRDIRNNVITLLTPVVEVDGRERVVDLWHYREKNPTLPTPPPVYWGHHVVHDNNRDQISLGIALSRNMMKAYNDFHPQVMHDLHESVPFMYISTGTGPFNPALDPLMIDEWHRMGFHEMDELTQRGLPGVWVHGFWDGWAPNYLFWLGAGRNTVA
ncbi:MAG TPA: M14 family zinc carboxypeptidase, partial [Thermoanaerobaculia bacterium]